jgi:hypothetical protein
MTNAICNNMILIDFARKNVVQGVRFEHTDR